MGDKPGEAKAAGNLSNTLKVIGKLEEAAPKDAAPKKIAAEARLKEAVRETVPEQ